MMSSNTGRLQTRPQSLLFATNMCMTMYHGKHWVLILMRRTSATSAGTSSSVTSSAEVLIASSYVS